MQEALSQSVVVQHWSRWRSFVLGYAFLAVFAVASRRAVGMTALEFGALALSLPAMAALWHQSTVRHLVRMHQFALGSGLRWLASRRLLSVLVRAALALLLTGTVLMQSVLFGRLEWILLAISPLLYIAISGSLGQYIERQFTRQAYARRGVFWVTQGLATILLTLVWLCAHIAMAEPPARVVAEVVLDLQQRWVGSPSGLIKWALDASAWVQATIDALEWAPNTPRWRLVVSLFFTPLAVFGHLSLTLSGLSLPISEVRRTVGEPLTDVDAPPPVGPIRAATWAAVTTVGVMFFFQAIGAVENLIGSRESPFAVQRLPECERIGGRGLSGEHHQDARSVYGCNEPAHGRPGECRMREPD